MRGTEAYFIRMPEKDYFMLLSILNALDDGICILDARGRVLALNSAVLRLLGFQQDEPSEMAVNQIFAPDMAAVFVTNFLASGQRRHQQACEFPRKDQTPLKVLYTLNRIRMDDGSDGVLLSFRPERHEFSEKKHAEATLLTLSQAMEKRLDAVLITDAYGIVEYVNPNFTRLMGYAASDVVGSQPAPLQADENSREISAEIWETLHGGGEWHGEIKGRKKTGELYWALETISPIRNAAGETTHYLAILQDITELRRDKEALQESEERFRQVAEMVGEWLWEQDPNGHYIYCSDAVRVILGYETEEILSKNYLDLLTPEDREHWQKIAPPSSTNSCFTRLLNRYRHKDGHEVFTESTGKPILDSNGTLIKWRGVDHNITHRKLYEDALRLRDRAIEAASVGINIADANKENYPNIYVNPALSRITGYAKEELLGRNMRILQGPDTDPAALREIVNALKNGRNCEVVLKNYRKDGTSFWNELRVSPVRNEQGALTHFVGVQTDVTERRRASEERRELEIAKQIQLSLLPKRTLQVEDAKIAGVCLPATHVGGDYFDYFHTGDRLDAIIADVSGHSVGAALIMAEMRSALKLKTRFDCKDAANYGPAQILTLLNEVLYDDLNNSDLFITMFYVQFDLATRLMSYANAGHNCPMLFRARDATCVPLDAEGLILGVKKRVVFEEKTLQIEKGDRLLLYTDGVTEALNEQGEFFDVPRLCDLFSSYKDNQPEIVIGRLIAALHAFRGKTPLFDDVSMAVMIVE